MNFQFVSGSGGGCDVFEYTAERYGIPFTCHTGELDSVLDEIQILVVPGNSYGMLDRTLVGPVLDRLGGERTQELLWRQVALHHGYLPVGTVQALLTGSLTTPWLIHAPIAPTPGSAGAIRSIYDSSYAAFSAVLRLPNTPVSTLNVGFTHMAPPSGWATLDQSAELTLMSLRHAMQYRGEHGWDYARKREEALSGFLTQHLRR